MTLCALVWVCLILGWVGVNKTSSSTNTQEGMRVWDIQDDVKQEEPEPEPDGEQETQFTQQPSQSSNTKNKLLSEWLTTKSFISGYLRRWKLLTCPQE